MVKSEQHRTEDGEPRSAETLDRSSNVPTQEIDTPTSRRTMMLSAVALGGLLAVSTMGNRNEPTDASPSAINPIVSDVLGEFNTITDSFCTDKAPTPQTQSLLLLAQVISGGETKVEPIANTFRYFLDILDENLARDTAVAVSEDRAHVKDIYHELVGKLETTGWTDQRPMTAAILTIAAVQAEKQRNQK